MKRLSRYVFRLSVSCMLITLLQACTSMPSQEQAKQDAMAANPGLDADLLYNLLAGEFAGVRGQMEQSIDYYAAAAKVSDDPHVIVRAAYIALYAGDDRKAIELTDQWQQLGLPDSNTVNRIRALSYLHLEQLEPAVQAIEKLLMQDGEVNEQSLSSLSHVLSNESKPEFALQVTKQLHQKYPGQPLILLLQARFEASVKQYDAALQHANQVIEIDSELGDAYLIRAQALNGLGQHQQAMQSVEMAVMKRPEDKRLRLQYARMLVQSAEYDKALEHFLVLQKIMPGNENVLLSLGLLSIEIAEYDKAKSYLQELLDRGYHNQQAHYYLGRIQQSQGEDMAAIANYQRVYAGEYWLDARLRSAGLLANSGRTEEALKKLESLNAMEHSELNRVKVYLAKGEVLRAASRNREAYSLYNTALSKSPENTDLLYARALTAEKLNMLDVAESDLKLVLMHEPENASALNALGYTLADRTERLEEAREYILKAAELLPDDPAILDSLGWVYYRLGEYQSAIKWLSKAFQALQDAEIAAHLGEVLWVSGKTDEAKSIWQKGQKLDGNQTVLKDTIQRFKQ